MRSTLAALLILLCSAFALSAEAFAAESAPAAELDPATLRQTSEKLDAYARLLGSGGQTMTDTVRYLSDFDFKLGPSGDEGEVLELIDVREETVADAVRDAQAAARTPPAIAELDASALAYADALAEAPKIFNEAARYYSSNKFYLTDHFERGKQLHPKIAAEIHKIFQTLPPFTKQLNDARKALDPQEAAYMEKAGASPARRVARDLLRTGLAAANYVPPNSRRDLDLKGFEAALDDFNRTVARYKDIRAGAKIKAEDATAEMRVDFLVNAFRDVHDGYVHRQDDPLGYNLELLGFYGQYSKFALDMLGIIAREGWPPPRAAATPNPVPAARSTPDIALPELSAEAFDDWSRKAFNVEVLLMKSNELITGWNRYAGWVDMAQGPTGKEPRTGYFFAINRTHIDDAVAKARELAAAEPPIPVLDDLIKRYADAMQAVLPTAIEASGYYARKEFLGDAWSGGRALHPRLVAAYQPFLEARADLGGVDRHLREAIEAREIDAIAAKEGHSANWRRRTILVSARNTLALAPAESSPSPDQLAAFDAAIDRLQQAVKDLDVSNDRASGRFMKEANKFVGDLRTDRRDYGRSDSVALSAVDGIKINLELLSTQLSMMGQAAGGE